MSTFADRSPLGDLAEHQSIDSVVYRALRTAIFAGDYKDGDRIVEVEVARRLSISRAPVREALSRLRQAGLVEHRPRRGWFVIGLTPDDLWDLYQIRAFVEGLAARRVATEASSVVLGTLSVVLRHMADAAERGDPDEVVALDVQFHEIVVQKGGSAQLYRMWRQVHPHDWTTMSVLRLSNLALGEIAGRHQVVLDALTSGDPNWAEKVVSHHIIELARRILATPTAAVLPGNHKQRAIED